MDKFFLGVDGGGTKTRAVIIDDKEKVLGRGEAGSTNYNNVGTEKVKENLDGAIKKALSHAGVGTPCYGVLGLAGCDTKKDKEALTLLVRETFLGQILKEEFMVLNDTVIGLYSGTKPPGVIIVAGTGCNVYGQDKGGREAWAGDWGFLLGDQGGAFRMGLSALETAVKSFDGRIEKSLLEDLVFKKFGSIQKLSDWVYKKPVEVEKIASVAPLVEKAVQRKDAAACEILKKTAFELSLGVNAVVKRLSFFNESFEIVLIGSVFTIKIILLEELRRRVFQFAPKAKFVFPKIEPAIAAALLARENYGQICS